MKKLMTMIAAVATAFGLFAADGSHYYSTSFEASVDTGCTGETFDPETAGWTAGTSTEAIGLGAYTDGEGYDYAGNIGERRTFASPLNNNYLKLETGSKTVGVELDAADIFIDQTVQFTGYEEVPAADAIDGQIAIWASAIDTDTDGGVEGETNLYARVGTGNGYQDVKINIDFDPAEWYRVTIKSLGNVLPEGAMSQAGFLIYINGVLATTDVKYSTLADVFNDNAKRYYGKGHLFTGLKTDSADIESVAFQGIGSIDDFVTSVEAPDFAAEVPFTVAEVKGAVIANVVKIEDGEEVDLDGNYAVMPGTTVKVYYTPAENWKLTKNTYSEVISEAGQDVDGSAEIEPIEGYAKLNGEVIGEDELEDMMAGLKDGDNVVFLQDSEIGEDLFGAETTIAVADGTWEINAVGDLMLYSDIEVNITLASEADVYFASAIAEGKTVDATAVTGSFSLDADIEVEGTLKVSEVFLAEDCTITLGDAGKVWSAEWLDKYAIFTNEKVDEKEEDDGWAYTVKTIEPACEIDGVEYETLADAFAAAGEGDKITMLKDIVLSERIFVKNEKVTLDLAGKKIEWDTAVANASGVLIVCRDADLTIDDSSEAGTGVIDAKDVAYAAIAVTHGSDPKNSQTTLPATLTVDGGTLKGYYYAVVGNGDRPNTVITINDGYLMSTCTTDGAGIYHPQKGTLNLNGGTIEGYTGVYIKAGDTACTVESEVTIIATGAKVPYDPNRQGDGFIATGDALFVDNCGYPGGEPNVDVKGGNFQSAYGAAVASVAKTGYTPVAGFVEGGTFTGNVKIDDAIAGGDYAFGPFEAGKPQTMVEAVAKINDVNYGTLDAAIAAAEDYDIVELLKDITLTSTLDIAKPVSIDLNEKTITFAANLETGIYAHDADAFAIGNGKITVADGRQNIAGSKAIYLLRTSAEFKDVEIDVPGFDYALTHMGNIPEPKNNYWTVDTPYTLDCENVAVKGNGSLYHLEYVAADLAEDCKATQYTDKGYFSEAHQAAIYSSCGAVVTVNGGTYSAVNALQTGNLGGTIVVKGGDFTGNIKSWMLDEDTRYTDNAASIQIEGGKFTGNFVYAANCSAESERLEVVISSGDFSDTEIPVAFIEQKADKVAYWAASTIEDYVTPAWKDVYAITFKVEDEADYVTNVVEGTELVTVKPADPVKEDYKFKGWEPEVTGVAESNATYTAKFEAIESGITITVTLNTGIASVTVDDQTITKSGEVKLDEAGDVTITLTAVDTIKIPVFKVSKAELGAQGTAKSKAYTVADGDTFTFSAEEAEIFDPEVSDDVAKQAIKDVAPEAAEKVDAVTTGEGAVNPKALAAWINAKSAGDVATALAGNYVKASVALNVAPITEATEIEIKDLSTGAAGAMTFEVDINDVAAVEAIKDMVEASSDLGAWDDHKLETTATYDAGKVTITPTAATDKAFMKVVIPQDAK